MNVRQSQAQPQDVLKQNAQTIATPTRHEGIGNALRSAFDGGQWGLPDDMRQLLNKLDR